MEVAFQPIVGAQSPTVWTSVGLISGGPGYESSSAGGLPVARVWPIGGRDSIGRPLRLSAAGPRSERQGLVWLMERRGRDRDGLKEWVKIEDVAPGQQPNHATARNPFLNLMPEVLSSTVARQPGCGCPDAGSKPQPAGLAGASFPNSRIRPSIAVPVNADLTEPTRLDDASGDALARNSGGCFRQSIIRRMVLRRRSSSMLQPRGNARFALFLCGEISS